MPPHPRGARTRSRGLPFETIGGVIERAEPERVGEEAQELRSRRGRGWRRGDLHQGALGRERGQIVGLAHTSTPQKKKPRAGTKNFPRVSSKRFGEGRRRAMSTPYPILTADAFAFRTSKVLRAWRPRERRERQCHIGSGHVTSHQCHHWFSMHPRARPGARALTPAYIAIPVVTLVTVVTRLSERGFSCHRSAPSTGDTGDKPEAPGPRSSRGR